MLKIANVTEEGRYGGLHARIISVASSLKEKGFETTVICPIRESKVFIEKLNLLGIPFVSIKLHYLTKSLPLLLKYILFFIPEVIVLSKIIYQNQYAIVHCNATWQFKGILAGRLAGAKTIWHLNDTQTPQIVKRVFSFLAVALADGFIITCQRGKDYYLDQENLWKKPSIVVQAPVDTEQFNPEVVEADPVVSQMPGMKIVMVSNINPTKGLETFVQMCHFLNEKVSQVISFTVVGATYNTQTQYAKKIQEMIVSLDIKNIHFVGPSDNIKGILKSADVYVCTSKYESGPISVWEAMSMAKPTVSTNVGDVAHFFEKGQCGFVVPVGDAAALAEKVKLLLEDESLRQTMGERAREFAKENLDVSIAAEKHASFYREMIKNCNN